VRLPTAGAAGRLPTEIDGLLRVVQVHDLRSVAAGAPGDRRAAACALLEQPLVADVASAPAMLDGSLT
jgi:alpha-galactosidase/6-phospho-beta-glucosidase family protein